MYGWCCKCGVTRLPTNDHSVHVWKRREGEGKLQSFLHVQSVFQEL